MRAAIDPTRPGNLLTSWLATVAALPLVVIIVVAGQGLGAVLGGATWIGVTLPVHLQPWALVNEPTLNFAATSGAAGYWLGGLLLPALVALTAISFLPRPKKVTAELAVIQTAFAMATGGLGWLPLLDPVEGHLARWLALHHLPSALLFVPPAVGAAAAIPAAVRLLAFQRATRQAPGSPARMGIVLLHLLPAPLLWIGVGSLARGAIPVLPTAGAVLPLLTALMVSAVFTVPPWVLPLEPGRAGTFLLLAAATAALGILLYVAGRPLPGGGAAGVLWARPNAYNNVRPWVHPIELYRHARPGRDTSSPSPSNAASHSGPVPPAGQRL